jgi:hypothetical protein
MAEVPMNIEIPMHILVGEQEVAQRWEYMHAAKIGTLEEFIALLNFLGKEGWQVCQRLDSVNFLLIRQITSKTMTKEDAEAEAEVRGLRDE